MPAFSSLRSFFSRIPRRYLVSALGVLVVGSVGFHWLTRPPAQTGVVDMGIAHVSIATIASLSSATSSLPVTGTVTSVNQATILAQTAGEIVTIRHTLGDHVSAGSVIAEFSNDSQRAGVLQAQGAYEAAQASLASARDTGTAGSSISVSQANQGVQNAENALQNSLQNAITALDDAVHTKADLLFLNPNTTNPQIILTVPDSQLVSTLRQERIQLQSVFTTLLSYEKNPPAALLETQSASLIANTAVVTQFLNNLTTAVNETPPSQTASTAVLAGYATSLAAAHSEVTAGLSSLIAAKSAYDSAVSGSQTATNAAQSGTPNTIAFAEAQVKQALGAYNAALANLEKTIIRSPIDGTIVSFPITTGDYVSNFSPVAIVSNPQALYVDTSVSSSDARTLAVGNAAVINTNTSGSITFIAPALNPLTNKIEVKIGVHGSATGLTDGETVPVVLNRTFIPSVSSDSSIASSAPSIPIAAVKMTPTGAVVFTVNASSTVMAQAVILGNATGDSVAIMSGVTPDQYIVTDARGLANGQTVIVTNP
ncbi:MAG TPA: HlyD family efflux transporter periplasmic adaptor subunit [Candidatus Paceibacterota bacterium]|nr:HlyD family efflux transporter periplasmic adaptor subunit [Candidatus Paceibacterota bacterium]